MPELSIPKTTITRELTRPTTDETKERDQAKEKELMGENLLGAGSEKVVIVDPRRPEKAIALYREGSEPSPEEAKELFYLHNTLHILFPHNFPHFYSTSGSKNPENDPFHSQTVKQRIEKAENPLNRRVKVRYPFRHVERMHRRWGIPLYFDPTDSNFMIGKDGGEYYVDSLGVPSANSLTKYLPYMEKNKYSSTAIEKVTRNINRLRTLQEMKFRNRNMKI